MAPVVKPDILEPTPDRPRVLVVDDEPEMLEMCADLIERDLGCRIIAAGDVAEAEKILAGQNVELLLTDVNLPDGDGISLVSTLHKRQPTSSAIVITGAPSMNGIIDAMRGGAMDFVAKPFTSAQLIQRIRKGLDRQAALSKQERRLFKLKEAVKRLNEARRLIGKKVDILCNDLVSAYGELSRQLDGVRTQEAFRKCVESAKDLEQLLCHAMDWLLRQIGYSNVGVWLVDEEGEFQLGAYMKYTIAGEPALTDMLRKRILPLAVRESYVRLSADDIKEKILGPDSKALKDQDVMAVNCTYLGDSLAAIVFFRDARSPFTDEDGELLKAISPIFALALAGVVRGAENGEDEPEEPFLGSDTDTQLPPPKKNDKPKKSDAADWWKRGEEPPF